MLVVGHFDAPTEGLVNGEFSGRVLAFISNLSAVRRILSHLQLPSDTPPLPSAADPPQLSFIPLECA